MLCVFVERNIKSIEVNALINSVIQYGKDVFGLINEDTYIKYDSIYKNILDFLVKIKHCEAYSFEQNFKDLEPIRIAFLKKHGQMRAFEAPYEKLIEYLNNPNTPWELKMLYLTHAKDNGKLKSMYQIIGENKQRSIVDDVCTPNIPCDDYFTITKQQHMRIYIWLACNMVNNFLNHEKIKDLILMVASLTKTNCDALGIDFCGVGFEEDFQILLNLFANQLYAFDTENNFLQTGLNYALTMFIMCLIEKIIKLYYRSQKKIIL